MRQRRTVSPGTEVHVIDREEVQVRGSLVGWILILAQLAFGFLTVALAVDERFARGKVVFDDEIWRVALGAAGAYLTYRASRAVVRTINRSPVELHADDRGTRLRGVVLWLIGGGFLLAALNEDIAARSIDFLGWVGRVYVAGGIYLLLIGALSRVDGYRLRQRQRRMMQARREPVPPYLSTTDE